MSALSIALITQLAATPACSAPGMMPEFWSAVIGRESSRDPLALHDDTVNMAFYPTSTDSAESLAVMLMKAGHSVGVGLSQLTATSEQQFQRKFGLTIRQALDPCVNMRAGALFYVRGALSTYNGGSPTASLPYAMSIQAAVQPVANPPASSSSTVPKQQPAHSHMRDLLHPDQSGDNPSQDLIQIEQSQPKDQQQ